MNIRSLENHFDDVMMSIEDQKLGTLCFSVDALVLTKQLTANVKQAVCYMFDRNVAVR